jgi:hypothetical protein
MKCQGMEECVGIAIWTLRDARSVRKPNAFTIVSCDDVNCLLVAEEALRAKFPDMEKVSKTKRARPYRSAIWQTLAPGDFVPQRAVDPMPAPPLNVMPALPPTLPEGGYRAARIPVDRQRIRDWYFIAEGPPPATITAGPAEPFVDREAIFGNVTRALEAAGLPETTTPDGQLTRNFARDVADEQIRALQQRLALRLQAAVERTPGVTCQVCQRAAHGTVNYQGREMCAGCYNSLVLAHATPAAIVPDR